MKAGILEAIEHLEVKEVPDPQLEPCSIVLKVKVCSICATDLRIYHQGHARMKLPHILGHEIAGQISAVGSQVSDFQVGDRVAITPRIGCGKCFYCQKGQDIYCLNSLSFGHQLPGGYAQYLLIPECGVRYGVVNTIDDTVSFEEAAIAETVACCLRAQKTSHVGSGDTVVVVGGGPVGIIHCRLAKANGAAKVILVERETRRLGQVNLDSIDKMVDSQKSHVEAEIAALTEDNGADVVIVACSSAWAQEQSLSLAGRGGRVNFFGGLLPDQASISIDSNLVHYREVSLQGSHSSTPNDNREALDMLARGAIAIDDLITHRFPLDSIREAFLFAESRNGMHVAVLP
ncbi:MAG: alcohol dehydrogenase catalytic domain-containing protein [Dehalococcoidia bacterium]|nr:alcohol dehydrogenase catalytic domain-containing protein [Dehalococcoidia bacterium]